MQMRRRGATHHLQSIIYHTAGTAAPIISIQHERPCQSSFRGGVKRMNQGFICWVSSYGEGWRPRRTNHKGLRLPAHEQSLSKAMFLSVSVYVDGQVLRRDDI